MTRDVREAIVLAGGFGTRLADAVPDYCKPMAPVAGRPFLRYVLDALSSAGFARVIIADGFRREQIESYFGTFYRGMEVVYSSEDTPLGTGGAVKRALSHCEGDFAFVLNGDTYFDCSFASMEHVMTDNVEAVLAVKRMHDFDRYGTVSVSSDGAVRAFHEKIFCRNGLVNAGAYLLRTNVFQSLPARFSLETEWLNMLAGSGHLRAVECEGDFIDIGIPEDYERAQTMLAPLARNWKLALFDRDGTINVDIGHLHEPEKLRLIPHTIELLRRYTRDDEYKVVVVTNQAGIAKGLYTKAEMNATHRALDIMLKSQGCSVDAYYFCPHHPDFSGFCDCRKPEPGMLLSAMRDFDATPDDCVMYGDSIKDALAARAAGVAFCYISHDGA